MYNQFNNALFHVLTSETLNQVRLVHNHQN